MQILTTIIPIFTVIFIGLVARRLKFMPDAFFEPANRLVYYIAIPAMIFRAISTASFHDEFSGSTLLITLLSIFIVSVAAWFSANLSGAASSVKGVFIQSSFHGNLGYIGLAVVFYFLGPPGLAKGSIFAGFIMIVQNILAVMILEIHKEKTVGGIDPYKENFKRIVGHPVIVSAILGIAFSLSGFGLPVVVDRSLSILSGMALPLALLIIGGSLSFDLISSRLCLVAVASGFKILVMPGLALVLFKLFSIPKADYLPAFILLSAPTATLVYVMAKEMGGDSDFAVAAISGCTLVSAITYTIWLTVLA